MCGPHEQFLYEPYIMYILDLNELMYGPHRAAFVADQKFRFYILLESTHWSLKIFHQEMEMKDFEEESKIIRRSPLKHQKFTSAT